MMASTRTSRRDYVDYPCMYIVNFRYIHDHDSLNVHSYCFTDKDTVTYFRQFLYEHKDLVYTGTDYRDALEAAINTGMNIGLI